jgi:hypothetical protein
MAVDADLVLTSGFSAEGMTYSALYYFNATGLFLIALIPKSIDDGFKTSKLLDATYGAPDREERMGLNENYSGCIAPRLRLDATGLGISGCDFGNRGARRRGPVSGPASAGHMSWHGVQIHA